MKYISRKRFWKRNEKDGNQIRQRKKKRNKVKTQRNQLVQKERKTKRTGLETKGTRNKINNKEMQGKKR